jgi:hypothetical protein
VLDPFGTLARRLGSCRDGPRTWLGNLCHLVFSLPGDTGRERSIRSQNDTPRSTDRPPSRLADPDGAIRRGARRASGG